MKYAVGSLIKVRGREWVVLPDSSENLIIARPLGGTDDEIGGICTALEEVESASFSLPDSTKTGDYRSCLFLRDALKLGFRSSAGPFRSFGKIAVEPRPYQLVPLLIALKLDPARLLISDDVGVGKTIEALLVARELIDRGECQRLTILCPPHLAEQWQKELRDKFHIDAVLVLSGTVRRLERQCGMGQSLFEVYPYTVVSMDYIKADRRRDEFIRTCPNLVVVDEAHTCSFDDSGYKGRHQRHELVKALATDSDRHLILVTATPHSGKEAAFRSLLRFLKEDFSNLPDELGGPENIPIRRRLAAHFVQRRRADIKHYLDKLTIFPECEYHEEHYNLSLEYKTMFQRILNYAREIVQDASGGTHRQRVRWWSALALLRSLASSPAAAAATLRSRSATVDTETPKEADEIGRRQVLDQDDTDSTDASDITPGADPSELEQESITPSQRRLREMAKEADKLRGESDAKLIKAVKFTKGLLKDNYSPIIFCRFIQTAEYVAEELKNRLPRNVSVSAVTGTLPPEEREQRVLDLGQESPRVLVCTDCLSEGVNLQDYFDAVMHYDLSWNPTRHEQREGRVDRYGQARPTVKLLTYYGIDNQIDGIVLDVLLRKHKTIRNSLGISVPVPADTNSVVEAIFEGLLLREQTGSVDEYLPGFEEYFREERARLHTQWDNAATREKRSRTMFSQEGMQASADEVAKELSSVQSAIGSGTDVENFTKNVLAAYGASISVQNNYTVFGLSDTPLAIREICGNEKKIKAKFELPVGSGAKYISRTHPIVEGLADYVLNSALDGDKDAIASRGGAIRTDKVSKRTTLILLRYRYHIVTKQKDSENELLAEDSQIVGFRGSPENADWIREQQAEELLLAKPSQNITPEQASDFVQKVIDGFDHIREALDNFARERGRELLDAHKRVRSAARWKGVKYDIRPELPPDVLGIYIYLPSGAS